MNKNLDKNKIGKSKNFLLFNAIYLYKCIDQKKCSVLPNIFGTTSFRVKTKLLIYSHKPVSNLPWFSVSCVTMIWSGSNWISDSIIEKLSGFQRWKNQQICLFSKNSYNFSQSIYFIIVKRQTEF